MKGQITEFPLYLVLFLITCSPYCVPPIMVWGWVRWWKGSGGRTNGQLVSFAGLLFSTASALLGIWLCLHPSAEAVPIETDVVFAFLTELGMQTALAALPLAILGVGWPNPIRWHALACSLLVPFFWLGVGIDI